MNSLRIGCKIGLIKDIITKNVSLEDTSLQKNTLELPTQKPILLKITGLGKDFTIHSIIAIFIFGSTVRIGWGCTYLSLIILIWPLSLFPRLGILELSLMILAIAIAPFFVNECQDRITIPERHPGRSDGTLFVCF